MPRHLLPPTASRIFGTSELRKITRDHLIECRQSGAPVLNGRDVARWQHKNSYPNIPRGVGDPRNYMAQQMAQQQSAYNAALNQIMMQRHSSHVHISNVTPGPGPYRQEYLPPPDLPRMNTEDILGLIVCVLAVSLLICFATVEIVKLLS